MNSFSLVIPIYNEEQNIEKLVDEIIKSISNSKTNLNYEIILVNDCSDDNSLKIILKLYKKKLIRYVNNNQNSGQSFSITEGIKKSNHNTIVTLDGDLQNDPKDIIKMLKLYNSVWSQI